MKILLWFEINIFDTREAILLEDVDIIVYTVSNSGSWKSCGVVAFSCLRALQSILIYLN